MSKQKRGRVGTRFSFAAALYLPTLLIRGSGPRTHWAFFRTKFLEGNLVRGKGRVSWRLLIVAVNLSLIAQLSMVAGERRAEASDTKIPVPPITSPATKRLPDPVSADFSPRPQEKPLEVVPSPGPPEAPEKKDAAVKGFVEGLSKELTAERKAELKIFSNPDGTRTARVFSGPIHYRDGSGAWKDIDTKLVVSSPGRYTNAGNSFSLDLSSNPADSNLATFRLDPEHSVGFSVQGAGTSVGVPLVTGDKITYPEIFPHTTLELTSRVDGLKEELVLASKDAPTTFTFPLRLQGLTPELTESGDVIYRDSSGAARAITPHGFMEDSKVDPHSGDAPRSYGVSYDIVADEAGKRSLQVSLDQAWINAPERVFPINVDPWYQPYTQSDDTYVMSPYNANNSAESELRVGTFNSGTNKSRAFLKFNALNDLRYRQIFSATYHAWAFHSYSCSARQLDIYRTAQGWDGTTMTTYPGASTGEWIGGANFAIGYSGSCPDGWASFDLTGAVRNWTSEAWPNYGLMMKAGSETDTYGWKKFNSWNAGANQPHIDVNYNTKPSMAQPVSPPAPGNGASIHTQTPKLSASASDPDNDPMQYWYRLALGSDAETGVVWDSGWVYDTQPQTPTLNWNTTYYWHVYSYDGNWQVNPDWVWSFRTANSPPLTPSPASPPDDSVLTSTRPTLSTSPVTDPDGDGVRYFFRISQSADAQGGGLVDSGWITATSWTPPEGALSDGIKYYWTVSARDDITYWAQSGWSTPRSLRIDLGLGEKGSRPYDRVGPAGVNLSNGNVVLSTSSPSVNTLGGPIGLSYSYNSQAPSIAGLRGYYFNDSNNNQVFDSSEKPSLVRTDPQVNFDWQTGSPNSAAGVSDAAAINPDWFLVRWKGFITVPASGTYQFGRKSDDATRIWIDGQLYRDGANWMFPTDPADYGPTKALTALQTLEVTIEYNEITGPSFVQLWVKGPIGTGGAQGEAIVPASWLTTDLPGLPDGWMLSADPDGDLGYTQARIAETSVVLVDATGATHKYRKTQTSAGSAWEPEEEEEGILANDATTGLLVLHADDGRVYNFTSAGLLSSVVSPLDDRKPAAPVYTWSGSPSRLTQIKDPLTGRAITLTYNTGSGACLAPPAPYSMPPSQMLCKVDYTQFAGGVTNLYYSSGHLARIEDPGGELTDFGYDSSGRLIEFRDPLTNDLIAAGTITDATSDSHKTQIAYTSGKATSITAPIPAVGAVRPQHSYEYVSGTVTKVHVAGLTEPNGYARQVTTNAAGQLIQERDLAGKATTFEWDSDDRLKRKTDPTDIAQTTIYDAAGRPIENYGPGKTSEFTATGTSTTAPRSKTFYDEPIQGLGAAWWDQPGLVGPPKIHSTLTGWSDWGTGSPNGQIPSDGFSGRLTGEINVATPGNYTFTADVDRNDGVRVFVNDRAVISRWDPYRESVLKDSPVSYWRLGEASGTTAADEKNVAAGSYVGGVGLAQTGALQSDTNTAASFDGSDDQVNIPHTSALSLTRFTVEAWVFPQSVKGDWQPLIVKENSGGGARNYGLFIIPNSTGLHYSFQDSDCATWRSYNSNYGMTLNQWNHLAMSYDGTSFKLYLNGSLDSTQSVSSNVCQNSEPVKIGKEISAYTGFLGRLDEVAIYGSALSSSRLTSHYSAGQAKLSGQTPTSLTAGAHRIRIDYEDPSGAAKLKLNWTPPGGTQVEVPMSVLKPRYGLVTTQIDADQKRTATEYAIPEIGLPTAVIVDPDALKLRSETQYEAAGSGGYFRRRWRTLPAGEKSKVSYDYFLATDTADNPCTEATEAIPQGGMLQKTTSADPDGAETTHSSIVREVRYDEQGRVVATRVVGDAKWRCITYDSRGRVTSRTDSVGKKTTLDYLVPGKITTSFPDSSGENRTTVSTTDWLGRGLTYTDEHGTTTRSEYDDAGRVKATYRKFAGGPEAQLTTLQYDPATGRLFTLTEFASGAGRASTFAYDDAGRITAVNRPNGVSTANTYDANRGWLNSISNKKASTELSPWTYTRLASGDVESEITTGRTRGFKYDGAGRLYDVTETGGIRRVYRYDANSNRCSTTSTTCDGSYGYDFADRLVSSPFATGYTYDSHGNLKSANPSTQPPTGSLNETFSFDAAESSEPRQYPIIVGQTGDVSADMAWAPATYASGSSQGSIASSGSASAPVQVKGKSPLSSLLNWNQGTRTQTDTLTGSVIPQGTASKTISPNGSGAITASLDWAPLPTYAPGEMLGSLAAGGKRTQQVIAKGEAYLSASVSWAAEGGSYANLALSLKSPSGEVVRSVSAANGGPVSLSYLAPDPGGSYTLEVSNTSASRDAPSFTLNFSSTTVSSQAATGAISPLQKWSRTLAVEGNGYVGGAFSWTQGKRTQNDSIPGSAIAAGGSYSHTISPDASGSITSSLDWAALPVYASASPSGSLPTSGAYSAQIAAKGSSYLSAGVNWTKGTRDETTPFSGSIAPLGSASHTIAPSASGTISANVDWNTSTGNLSGSGYISSALDYHDYPITVSSNGTISATVTWPKSVCISGCDIQNRQVYGPNSAHLTLSILDGNSNTVASQTNLTGHRVDLSYPVTASYLNKKNYTVRVSGVDSETEYFLGGNYPVTANVDLELYSPSGTLVTAANSTTAKPETLSATGQAPGTYTLKVVSKDHTASYSLNSTYRVAEHANLTLRVRNPAGAVVASNSGATGSLGVYAFADAPGGNYTVELVNNSSALSVPSYSLPHSATTVLIQTLSGSIAQSGTYTKTLSAADRGVIASEVDWTKGSKPKTDTLTGSVGENGTSSHSITPDASGTISAEVDWSPSTTSGTWSGSVGTAEQRDRTIRVGDSGYILATLSWPSAVPSPDLDLYLVDADSGSTIASREGLTGNTESFSWYVSGASYSSQKSYILRVRSKAIGSSYTLSSTWPVSANLDLELYDSSGSKVGSSAPSTAKPRTMTVANRPAGTYTVKVVSKDYSASYTLKPTYPILAFAELKASIKDSSDAVLQTTTSSSGKLSIEKLVESAGNYTLEIKNISSDTAVPSFSGKAASPEKHWANLDIELWNPSGVKVAETTSATARPESLTYDAPSPGTYTIKVASRDWETSGYTLSAGYQMLAYAPVTARIKDGLGSVVKTISRSSGSLAIDYLAPLAGTYTLEIEDTSNETHVPSFSGTTFSSKIRYADLDLELWNSAGQKVAQLATSSRPESFSYQASPGDYTLKVVSKDFEADYSIAAGYPMVGFADLTFNLKDPQGTVVETARSQSGSVSLNHVTTGGGSYSLEIKNNSSELPVPSYQASWSLDSTMKLELKDPSGAVIALDSTQTSPNSVSKQGLAPGKYTVVATPTGGAGSATLSSAYPGRPAKEVIKYDGNDHATEIDDGTTKVAETLAPSGRVLRRVVKDSATGEVQEDTIFGYDSDSDSPAYSRPYSGGAVTTYIQGPNGLLVVDKGGNASYPITNGHGDIVGTADSSGAFSAYPVTDEFGVGEVPADRLGWLGSKERFFTGGNLRLIRMGHRLYDPRLGRFLSIDPVPGGSFNDYDYSYQDPINNFDLDGQAPCRKGWQKWGCWGASKGTGYGAKSLFGLVVGKRLAHFDIYLPKFKISLRGATSVARLGGVAGGIASGFTQLAGDLLKGGRSGWQMSGRALLAGVAGGLAVAGAIALCTAAAPVCVALLGAGFGLIANKAASAVSKKVGLGEL